MQGAVQWDSGFSEFRGCRRCAIWMATPRGRGITLPAERLAPVLLPRSFLQLGANADRIVAARILRAERSCPRHPDRKGGRRSLGNTPQRLSRTATDRQRMPMGLTGREKEWAQRSWQGMCIVRVRGIADASISLGGTIRSREELAKARRHGGGEKRHKARHQNTTC